MPTLSLWRHTQILSTALNLRLPKMLYGMRSSSVKLQRQLLLHSLLHQSSTREPCSIRPLANTRTASVLRYLTLRVVSPPRVSHDASPRVFPSPLAQSIRIAQRQFPPAFSVLPHKSIRSRHICEGVFLPCWYPCTYVTSSVCPAPA